jgi:hypothetical protein
MLHDVHVLSCRRFPSDEAYAAALIYSTHLMDPSTVRRANAGDAEAQHALGEIYENGFGVLKDSVDAVVWFRKAAEQGHAQAQFNLGLMYRKGERVAQDAVEGAVWCRKAAEQGHSAAQSQLGAMYSSGEGVPQDYSQAGAWSHKAGARDRAYEEERRKRKGEMTSLLDCVHCAQSLVRDVIVIRAFKKTFPTDGAGRVERLSRGDTPTDDELDMLHDLIHNEGRLYLQYYGKRADYDDSDPFDVDLYSIDVRGLGGIYVVKRGCIKTSSRRRTSVPDT